MSANNVTVKKKKRKFDTFDYVNFAIMGVLLAIIIYPLYYTIIASFSNATAVASGDLTFWPIGPNLKAYQQVFNYEQIWVGYANSIFYTVTGTCWNLILTIPTAYALSKKYMPWRGPIMTFFLITMYFGGGMIPTYLQIKNMGLLNTRLVLIILGGISIYNMIICRTYFSNSISDSLYEAADIDGAGEFKKFLSIALPLAKPILAVMVLYYAVGHWNSYFSAMIYTSRPELEPLQSVLRRVLIENQNALDDAMFADQMSGSGEELKLAVERANMAYTMKYAMVFIASAPLLAAYPFVQKHFVKGVMIGAVKE